MKYSMGDPSWLTKVIKEVRCSEGSSVEGSDSVIDSDIEVPDMVLSDGGCRSLGRGIFKFQNVQIGLVGMMV